MRTVLIILRKEFKQIFRDRMMIPIIFFMPFVQTLILVYAATLELKNTNITIVDIDHSDFSRHLIAKFNASPFFKVNYQEYNYSLIEDDILKDETKSVLIIPANFEKDIRSGVPVNLQMNINAIDGQSAGLINIYVNQILSGFIKEELVEKTAINPGLLPASINVKSRYWYNEELNFKHFMLPGILVILISMISIFLTSLNLVKEKERGTIEQINVTPIHKWQFLIGKMLPFMIIGIFELTLGLSIGMLLFNLPFAGSVLTLFVFTLIYLFAGIGMGLLISDFAATQQQAMFTIFFFFLIIILMSGIFTSVESMPDWAQSVNKVNPVYYFMRILRSVILKGSTISDLLNEFIALIIFGITVMSFAVWRYRKTV
ncbi:MAG TPA: ABC transporter permease [Bacteroidales bacterium]|nr:ABC transporter permease [Bacteroidales bacterium]